ncbi:hypothetical protein BpHYR1_018128 [Brachionus plicatilis]|uniref:Uncharacterized protein n=1 Tax=Brachionus plicatilis TaxID=10195 RepID=A0A3M7RL76_BRAPC|nr:hypothetical protein BpHYR1_018128 [Brachionus plicatilis]
MGVRLRTARRSSTAAYSRWGLTKFNSFCLSHSTLILELNHLGLGRLRALGTWLGIAMDEEADYPVKRDIDVLINGIVAFVDEGTEELVVATVQDWAGGIDRRSMTTSAELPPGPSKGGLLASFTFKLNNNHVDAATISPLATSPDSSLTFNISVSI